MTSPLRKLSAFQARLRGALAASASAEYSGGHTLAAAAWKSVRDHHRDEHPEIAKLANHCYAQEATQ